MSRRNTREVILTNEKRWRGHQEGPAISGALTVFFEQIKKNKKSENSYGRFRNSKDELKKMICLEYNKKSFSFFLNIS